MILASNVSFSYPGHDAALRNVSFELEDGKNYALMGANGAGKSTLLSLLCGLELPQSGSLTVDGIPLHKEHVQKIRERVGMVFQNPDDQLFMPTVYDDVAFGLRNLGIREEQVRRQVEELLARMGISHLADRPPYRLSGGEKRSAAIATALVLEPHTLLMDEPTAFLDPRAKRSLIALLKSLDINLLIATHDIGLVRELAQSVLILKEGTVFGQGDTSLLENKQTLEEALLA